jgi:hypothetical protein
MSVGRVGSWVSGIKLDDIRPVIGLLPSIVLGGTATWFLITDNVTLSARELLLIQGVQFISSLWFGWSVSYLFAAASFREQQRKFALSAYRRISEIDYTLDRLGSSLFSVGRNVLCGQPQIELSGEQVDHGLEVSD